MTKNQTIKNVTDDYLSNLVITSVDDIKDIESDLMNAMLDEFDAHNSIAAKDKKWRVPESLNFPQIGQIISTVFNVKCICCTPQNNNPAHDLLGLYVDDYVIDILGDTYEKKRGIYITDEVALELLAQFFDATITINEINEVIHWLKRNVEHVRRCEDRDLIAVNNGIFHYDTKELEDFSPDYVFLTKSCVNYNPNAVSPVIKMPNGENWEVEAWMADLNDDQEIADLFWEITSALLRPNVRWNKAAMLMSNTGNNGKGTLVEMWRALLGDGAHASIPLSDFGKDFMLEPLIRASAIITDENDVGGYLDKAANLKAVITNDVVSINRKFKEPISYQVRGFMVQCLNDLPRIKDKSDSFFRRQLFIPMTKCFTGMEIPEIKNDYLHRKEVLEYVMKKALETNFYKLSEPESCKMALNDFKEFNDPVRQFWGEFKDEFKWNLLPFQFLYDLFVSWFRKNAPSGTVLGKNTFMEDLLNVVGADLDWQCEDRKKKIRVTSKSGMDEPEPLILEYGLDDWKNKVYRGSNKLMLAKIDPADSYRGLVRLDKAGSNDVSSDGDNSDNTSDSTEN